MVALARCLNGHFFDHIKYKQCPFCGEGYAKERPADLYPTRCEPAPHMTCAGPSVCREEWVSDTYPSVYEEQLFMLYAGPPV